MRLFDLSQNQLPASLHLIKNTDKVLLRQEAVYLMNTGALNQLQCELYCLFTDASVRGVIISEPYSALNDSQWLELVLQAEQIL